MPADKSPADAAEELYREALASHREGELDRAIALHKQALAHHPRPAHVLNDLGVALRAHGQPRAAIACYRHALVHDPEADDSWSNLANACWEIGDIAAAETALAQARELAPDNAVYLRSYGMLMRDLGRTRDAERFLEQALAQEPGDQECRFQLGVSQLMQGSFPSGFANYEARLQLPRLNPREMDAPLWDGSPLEGKTLLVHAEQGLGDTLMFARFLLPLLERAGGPVVSEVLAPLLRLFRSSFPRVEFVAHGEELPAHQLRIPFPSLPHVLGTDDRTLVPAMPYLRADPALRDGLRQLPDNGRPRIALTWSGNRDYVDRSCPFELFMALAEDPAADFYSLQRGDPAHDITEFHMEPFIEDISGELGDFAGDAAILAQFDLVITIDTSLCHLAGGLDVPCWTLLTDPADWRFLTDHTDSPWYPGMRLFRGPRKAGWEPIIARVKEELANLLSEESKA